MKKIMIIFMASLVLIGCTADKKRQDAATPILAEDHSNDARSESDAVSQGAGEQEAITETQSQEPNKDVHSATYYFDFDNSKIHEDDKVDLKLQVQYLLSHPNAKVLLAGHTDEIGSREYNVALGERRANSVLNFLRFAGIKPNQIRVLSYGQEKPKALGHNQEAYRINRRVELTYEVS